MEILCPSWYMRASSSTLAILNFWCLASLDAVTPSSAERTSLKTCHLSKFSSMPVTGRKIHVLSLSRVVSELRRRFCSLWRRCTVPLLTLLKWADNPKVLWWRKQHSKIPSRCQGVIGIMLELTISGIFVGRKWQGVPGLNDNNYLI